MSQSIQIDEAFIIEFQGNTYPCEPLKRNNSIFYRVKFPNNYLYLAQAISQNGVSFWTSVPEDPKLKHVVQELGDIISKHHQ